MSVSVGGWVYIRMYVGVGVLVKVPAVCVAVHTYSHVSAIHGGVSHCLVCF